MKITGPRILQLRKAMVQAFDPDEFDDVLLLLNIARYTISQKSAQSTRVREVIEYFNRRDLMELLVWAATTYNPSDAQLNQVVASLGMDKVQTTRELPYDTLALAQTFVKDGVDDYNAFQKNVPLDDKAFELMVNAANSPLDVIPWYNRLEQLTHQVCRIELKMGSLVRFGTGFLVGSDLVLTNYHVMKRVIDGQIDPSVVKCRFDYAVLADGVVTNAGKQYSLADGWLEDNSPYSELDLKAGTGDMDPSDDQLDYALIRLEGKPGKEELLTVPGHSVDKRGWIELLEFEHDFIEYPAMFILQHPKGTPLKLAMDTQAIIGVNGNATRVRYRTNTEPGSSGSPCFDASWNMIALHHLGDPEYDQLHPHAHAPQYNQGIPTKAILALLDDRGKLDLLGK